MIIIRTAEDHARALMAPLDPILHDRLEAHRNHLLDYPDYPFEELALFLITQPGDTLETITAACPFRLVKVGQFTFEPETVDRHGPWIEILFVLSDDGFGIVLFVDTREGADPELVEAAEALLPRPYQPPTP